MHNGLGLGWGVRS